jgi:hypothetical protein
MRARQVAPPAERSGRAILTGQRLPGPGSPVDGTEEGSSMSKLHRKSFAFVASVVGAALITGAASAQTAAPVPAPAANAPGANGPPAAVPVAKPQKKPQKKSQKKVTPSVVVVVTNSRSVAVSELDATPSGGTLPKTIVSNLAPGKKITVTVATAKSCVFNLHGAYADGSSTDSTSVDLCKDKNVNLVE